MVPLQQLAVMIPPTMTFASRSGVFQVLSVGNNRYKVEAAEQLKAGERLEFEISGAGPLLSVPDQIHAPSNPPNSTYPALTRSGDRQAQTQNAFGARPVTKLSVRSLLIGWWMLGAGAALMLGTLGLQILRRKYRRCHPQAVRGTGRKGETSVGLVEALKEGLFQLESDRLQGAIPIEKYTAVKQALDGTIAWAVSRNGARRGATSSEPHPELTDVSTTAF
jgi:hypothetical protein